jgi:hypothetical protein
VNDGDEGQGYGRARRHMEIRVVPVQIARGVRSLFALHHENVAVGNVVVGMAGNGSCDDSDVVETGVVVVHLKYHMLD